MRLLITRPKDDAEPLAELLGGRGIETVIEPLLDIRDLVLPAAQMGHLLDGVQGLLVTSANGLRAFARASKRRDLAVCAVGESSANAARQAGFSHVDSSDGDVVALAAAVIDKRRPGDGALLHVAGTQVAGDLAGVLEKAGFEVRRAVLYEAVKATQLSPAVQADIAAGKFDGVVLFSPRTAESFATLIGAARLAEACRQMTAYCLSPAVAEKVRAMDWARLAVADHPDQQALIRIIEE